MKQVAVVKYNAGNTFSVMTALERLEVTGKVTDDAHELQSADYVIFPGVGAAGSAMRYLRARGLDSVLCGLKQPVLGICLGFQLMCANSEEDSTQCLGIVPADVSRLCGASKIPHVGWSRVMRAEHPIFTGVGPSPYLYFVHSFRVSCGAETIARCQYGEEFAAAAVCRNFVGVQFHPEKSGSLGERIIRNFLEWKPV
jgi:glutamine amidotransferase